MGLKNFLDAINGHKTTIGAVFLFSGTVFSQVVVGIWHVDVEWIQPLIQTLDWIGMTITGIGVIHKVAKK